MTDFSFTANAHPAFIESMYRSFRQDPNSIEESWRDFFRGFDFAQQSTNGQ